ncbi:MAG: site-specific DNA-methyltransferase [Nitrososphaerota archaeon]|jgi:site-specific DNA-methyltransferase (cytosine-N4-specific)|nr:site-specific DNA-methyltransferase [Nitrososphaerota archaeon]MDG6929786.1 site-specific DNA-methyltransferase [Nitrososphaerota archaeon]
MAISIINKNVIDALRGLPAESVDCIITSPPYYGLRFYKNAETVWGGDPECKHEWGHEIPNPMSKSGLPGPNATVGARFAQDATRRAGMGSFCLKCGAWKGQLGLEPAYQMYLDHLMLVTKELNRVLKKTGTLWWNMGDTYAGGGSENYGHGLSSKQGQCHPTNFLNRIADDIPAKCLMLIPERFAIAMIDNGWILRNKIIWHKVNGLPASVTDRLANKYELVYLFTKSGKYYFNLDSIRKPILDPLKNHGKSTKIPPEEAELFGYPSARFLRKKNQDKTTEQSTIKHDAAVGRHGTYQDPLHAKPINPKGANPGDIWNISTRPHKFAHFAVYPETLVEPMIKAGCPENGVVLDPFAGSGTTGVVAQRLGRSAILIEISAEYVEIIRKRLGEQNAAQTVKKAGIKLDQFLYCLTETAEVKTE